MKKPLAIGLALICILGTLSAHAADGYEMWLRYPPIEDRSLAKDYQRQFRTLVAPGESAILASAAKELESGIADMLGEPPERSDELERRGSVVIGTPESSPLIADLGWGERLAQQGPEGYLIETTRIGGRPVTVIASEGERGVLYTYCV